MQTLTATYRIVTPMFLGDARQQATDIRPPSFKGGLRFWWRAFNWGRFRQDKPDDAAALRALNKAEADLFGAAAEEGTGNGQSKLLLSVQANGLQNTRKDTVHGQLQANHAARYLGYGLMTAFGAQAGQLTRSCINDNQTFTVKLACRDDRSLDSVREALIALGLLGGLGSRSRHGFGSICLEKLTHNDNPVWQAPTTLEAYATQIRNVLAGLNLAASQPPYSAISQTTRLDVLLQANTAYRVLNEFGKAQMFYRSWGHGGQVLQQPSEKRFKPDHDWKYNHRPANFHPRRVVFGLPHNYGPNPNMHVTPEHHERRASPLFFHVHRLTDQSFIGISLLLKSAFLPEGERINAGGTKVPANIEWNVITGFLDGMNAQNTPRFPERVTL